MELTEKQKQKVIDEEKLRIRTRYNHNLKRSSIGCLIIIIIFAIVTVFVSMLNSSLSQTPEIASPSPSTEPLAKQQEDTLAKQKADTQANEYKSKVMSMVSQFEAEDKILNAHMPTSIYYDYKERRDSKIKIFYKFDS